ncbi:inverse autotransporter beta domain-containing protein [Mesorhizobium sp. WSM3860]|uniref:inverse autotransporter beta domain-containing protein n=1 Tax=Mesorhizobium sp. WSM3860 TaxID=2029403 RepID=UPI000BAEB58E|nr:inverse autotransporter beta domain-containing protein [Mesorhizobium sp. WSM3860]PBC01385.1 hypothetical protein CK220_26480 [Mesorhizobium sp. WSM3860]
MAARADDAGLWQPQVRAIVGANNNGANTALEGFLPLKQNLESVLFLDVRSKYDFDDGFGQDVGLGVRRIVNPDLMIGGYAYLNIQNRDDHQFVASTLGLEAITSKYDAHVNVYLPLSGDRASQGSGSTLSMVGNQLLEEISAIDHRTYAAWGIEGEVGIQAPIDLPENHSLRFDIGAYHFADPDGDDRSVTGAKAGLEYTIGDVIGTGTSLTFTGEVRNDNRDDTQFAGGIRLTVPLNAPGKRASADDASDPISTVIPGLRKRLNERVRGDIGVRLESQDEVTGTTSRVAINAATNAAFGLFYFSDGGLAGAGTFSDPTTLDDAVTKAGANGVIVALGGNGNITTGGVNLAGGQAVIGGGGSVQARLIDGSVATYNFGGSNGTIQGTNVANNVITLASNNTLSGITITGGADGIFGNNAAGTTLTNVTVTGTGGDGADFTGNSTTVNASGFTATGNGLDGLHIEDNGTYNFTGTTLLQDNGDDGLDITGQGTYSFATVNALDNTDRGMTVQGTSSSGSFTTTGGTVSGNGGMAVSIDPITAHVALDSISQSGGTSGVVLDQVSGSFTVNGATTISNTTGPAIAVSDSPATVRFGDISIANPGGSGMSFSGVNAAVVAGNIVISGLGAGQAGLDFSGSQTAFTALSANISGSGAGSIGIDLAQTTGDAAITITNGGSISGVDTGVRLGIAGSLANSANAEFTFGGGSIAGLTASLDARGLNQMLGHYAFGKTVFSGLQLFDVQNVIFVGGVGSSGDGSSTSSLLAVNLANAETDSDAIFVLVNQGAPIDAVGGFTLSDGQTLASFGNGRTFSLGGVPVNVTGDNIQHHQVVSDPGGGAATLTNSGAGDVVTAANGNALLDFNISGGSGAAINATGVNGLTVQGLTVGNVATGLVLDSVTGTVSVDDFNVQNASQTGVALVNSSATINFTGNTTITNAGNVALFANDFDGTAAFEDLDISGGGYGISIRNGSNGTLTFGAGSSVADTGNVAFDVLSSSASITYNGVIDQTGTSSAVRISGLTGGSATFGGKITASTGAANAIDLSGNTGSTIDFTGGLDLTTDGGFAFSAINGGTLTVTGASNTVATGAGLGEKGVQIGGTGITIGAAGVNFSSVTVDGSGGAVSTGIVIDNTSGGNVTFGAVDINRVNGDAIRLTNVASGIYTFNGTTKIDTVVGSGPGFVVQGSAATVNVDNLITTNVSGADVSLTNNTGTIGIGGTITNSGTGDGVVVSGGSAAITVSAGISSSATSPGTAVKIDGIAGGSVALSGNVTSTGTGNLFAIGTTTAPTGGAITFGLGTTLTASGGGGAVIGGLGGGATFNAMAALSITGATGNGLSVSNVASSANVGFGNVTVSGTGGDGIDIGSNAGLVTFSGATTVTMGVTANTAGIDFSGTNANVLFGTTTINDVGANQTGIDFSGSSTAAGFGLTTITGTGALTSRGIDLSSTTGNKTITFEQGSKIDNLGVGVELASDGTTATSANANFTFGDGNAADGLESTIIAAAGGYTVNTIGLDPTLGNYDFDDVAFTGSAHLASAPGGVTLVSQSGGTINAGTFGLSQSVNTISLAAADALTGTQTFAFVGGINLGGSAFTLDSGQSITGFGNSNAVTLTGTIQPVNVQGNLGATGGNVTGDEAVVTGTGDLMHLLGNNSVRNTAFDFSGASGAAFLVDQSAVGFSNAGGIFIEGVTVSNVAAGQTAFMVAGLDTNLSITNNNVNVAGTLLDVTGGTGTVTLTRGTLPNSGSAGTLTGGGLSIANRTGGAVNFTDQVTIGGNGVSLTNNTGSSVSFADLDVATNGATAFSATGGGAVNVTTGTVSASSAQAVSLDGIAANINFASTSATFGSGSGIDLQNLSGTVALGTGTLTNSGSGTAFNVGSATAASGGNATISYGGEIASNGTGAAASIQELTGGSVTLLGNLTDGSAGGGGNIVVAGIDNGTAATVTFSGTTKQASSGATDAVNLSNNADGTINFTNGGLAITSSSGAGFVASGGGTVSVGTGGSANTINTTTGTALDLSGATVGTGGVNFDSVSVNGAATGVALDNVASSGGGAISLGAVNLLGITSRGVDVSGTLGASLGASSLDIGLNAANAVGFDLNGASLGASSITAGDFDVDGGGFAGTLGIDMAGTTGTGTIQLGDTLNNNPAGQTSTITNVAQGVQFSSATNANLVFGDGQATAESSISTFGNGQVIHATDSLPTNGDYNFNDVNFTGDTSNLSPVKLFYIDAAGNTSGTGDGSFANPGSVTQAEASSANVFILVDKNAGGTESINLANSSFDLKDGQALISFKSGDAAIDVSQLGVGSGVGAPASFQFTTVQATTVVSAPGGLDSSRPILASNGSGATINLPTTGTGTITAGVENVTVQNSGSGAGIFANATAASNFVIRNNDITAGGAALSFATTGGTVDMLQASIDNNVFQRTAAGTTVSFGGQNLSAAQDSILLNSFSDNSVTGNGTSGGIAFNNVHFDIGAPGGTLTVGTTGARVQGDGLNFLNPIGTLNFTTLNVANNAGTGVLVDTKGAGTTFTLNNTGGVVDTTSGAAFNLDPLTVGMSFSSVTSTGGASGIIFDTVAGSFTVSGATSISGTSGFGIDAINTNTGTFNFNTVTVNNTSTAGGGIHVATGSLNVGGLANIDTAAGVGVSQGGGTVSFAGGITVDTTSGTGILGTAGAMTISATGGSEMLNATGGQAISLSGVAANIALDSTSSAGGTSNVGLSNVTGTVNLGSGALSAASGAAFNVTGGTANISYSGSITKTTAGNVVSIASRTGGTTTLSGTISATGAVGNGIVVNANSGSTINFSGAAKTLSTGTNAAVSLTNNTGSTVNFTNGGLVINTSSGTGFSATGGGTVTVQGTGNTITSTTGTALNIANTTIGASDLTFQKVTSNGGSANGIILDSTGSSGGLHVTGTGTAGSGGTIATKTGADGSTTQGSGIYLNNTSDLQLSWMQLNDFQNYGIVGTNVTGLALDHVVISGTNGTSVGGIGEGAAYFTGLSGSAAVSNSTFTGAAYDAFHVFNDGGQTLNRLTITGSTFATQSGAGNASNDAVALQATGGTFNVTMQSSTVTSARGDMFQLNLLGTVSSDLVLGGATASLGNMMNNTNQNIVSGGGGITIGGGGPANNVTLTYNISHNTISGAAGAVLAVAKGTGTNASFVGTIDSNTIGTQGVAGSGSTGGEGIAVYQDGAGNSSTTITNNHVSGVVAARGAIDLLLRNGGGGTMTAVVQGNTIDTLDQASSFSGIYIQSGSNTVNSGSPDNNKLNLTIGGAGALRNTIDLGANAIGALVAGIVLEQEGNSRMGLIGSPNYVGTPYDFSAIQAYVAANNTGTFTNAQAVFAFGDSTQPAGGGFFGGPQF